MLKYQNRPSLPLYFEATEPLPSSLLNATLKCSVYVCIYLRGFITTEIKNVVCSRVKYFL
jgi:hypothetical protein